MKELVVLLSGNFVVIPTKEDEQEHLTNLLKDCCKAALEDQTHYLQWGDFTILSRGVIGWYFRTPVKSVGEKLLGLVEKTTSEGDDWKSDEDND